MMAAELSHEGTEELTNQQKRQLFREKMIVEVRVRAPGSSDEGRWFEAKIVNTNNVGAFCHYLSGSAVRHWHWRDVRLCEKSQRPRASATLGEIVRQHEQHDVPRKTPLPAPAALAHALAPRPAMVPTLASIRAINPDPEKTPGGVPATDPPPVNSPPKAGPFSAQPGNFSPKAQHTLPPRPAPILIPRAELRMAEPPSSAERRQALPIRVSKSPQARETEIGEMIKAERLRRQMKQLDLADAMNRASKNPQATVYNSRISRIEFGKSLPTDDELQAFVEVLGLDLDQCIAARDRDQAKRASEEREQKAADEARRAAELEEEKRRQQREERRNQRHAKAAAEGRVLIERPNARADRPVSAPTPKEIVPVSAKPVAKPVTEATSGRYAELADLVEAMIEIVPMPLDAEQRKAWFRCVKELFHLSAAD